MVFYARTFTDDTYNNTISYNGVWYNLELGFYMMGAIMPPYQGHGGVMLGLSHKMRTGRHGVRCGPATYYNS